MSEQRLYDQWNRSDHEGSIQPPLSEAEISALAARNIYPETTIKYDQYSQVARHAFIACEHFRVLGNPDLTADTVAAFVSKG